MDTGPIVCPNVYVDGNPVKLHWSVVVAAVEGTEGTSCCYNWTDACN